MQTEPNTTLASRKLLEEVGMQTSGVLSLLGVLFM